MKKKKTIQGILTVLLWTPILFFSGLLIHNALLYYTFDPEYGILPEKTEALKDPVWKIALYIHILTGIFCLSIPILSFLGKYVSLKRNLHILLGKFYVFLTLLLVSPTGMYLALYAKGGFMAQAGFMVQGILISLFTYQGYVSIQQSDRAAHIQWMIRSYAMATAVLSFRIFHALFFFTTIPYQDIYGLSQWLGIVVNALIAELVISYSLNSKKNVPLKINS